MSNAFFARVQLLLEQTQAKIGEADVRWQNSETQIRGLTTRLQALEGQVAMLRAQSMTATELARRDHGEDEEES